MKENFNKAFEYVIGFEGHLSVDKDDPGGLTIWGICKRDHPQVNENTTIEEAKEIYRKEYWNAAGCDNLPNLLDIAVFDCAVNQGVGTSLKILKDSKNDINLFMRLRLRKYSDIVQKNPKLLKFLRGWMLRVLNLWDKLK